MDLEELLKQVEALSPPWAPSAEYAVVMPDGVWILFETAAAAFDGAIELGALRVLHRTGATEWTQLGLIGEPSSMP